MTVLELERAVRRMLAEAHAPCGEENRISSADLRANLGEYLEELEEQFERAPALAAGTFWTMWLMDADDALPAAIAAARLAPAGADLFVGSGDAGALRPLLAETDPDAALRALQLCCAGSLQRIQVPRRTFEAWVGFESSAAGGGP